MRPANRLTLLAVASSCALAFSAMPASAAAVLGSTACTLSDISPGATACQGWYEGNLNSGNSTDLANEALIVNSLLGTSYTGSNLPFTDVTGISGSTITFASALTGTVLLGVHVGAANGAGGIGYDGTAFYTLVDPGSSVTLNIPGLSNARVFGVAAVPEPGTWAMMLLGLGSLAWLIRRNRRAVRPGTTTITYKGFAT
jgi:hypothetical protein